MADLPLLASLWKEVRDLLADMATVASAPAANLHQGRTSLGKPESKVPTGDNRTMAEEWAQRFHDHAQNELQLRRLLRLGRLRLAAVRGRHPVLVGEHGDRESPLERDERIVNDYQGLPPDEAAEIESELGTRCTPANVRRVRLRNDRDPEGGREREVGPRRQALAHQLRAEGKSERQIAMQLNVSRATVRRSLGLDTVERRAA